MDGDPAVWVLKCQTRDHAPAQGDRPCTDSVQGPKTASPSGLVHRDSYSALPLYRATESISVGHRSMARASAAWTATAVVLLKPCSAAFAAQVETDSQSPATGEDRHMMLDRRPCPDRSAPAPCGEPRTQRSAALPACGIGLGRVFSRILLAVPIRAERSERTATSGALSRNWPRVVSERRLLTR